MHVYKVPSLSLFGKVMNIHNDKWWPPIGLILKIINLSWFDLISHLCNQYILKNNIQFYFVCFQILHIKNYSDSRENIRFS